MNVRTLKTRHQLTHILSSFGHQVKEASLLIFPVFPTVSRLSSTLLDSFLHQMLPKETRCAHLFKTASPSLFFQMASTGFQPHASFESSSSQRTCWAAASPSAFRTCPRSTSCPRCWVTSWRACPPCFQCPSRMFSSSTFNRIWTQRPAAS